MHAPGVPVQLVATGNVPTSSAATAAVTIKGLVLSAGAAAPATAVINRGGAGGTAVLNLAAVAGTSVVVSIPFSLELPHVTLAGAGASITAFL